MKNIYLAVVILIAVLVIAGGLVIFLTDRSSETDTINLSRPTPAAEPTQMQEEATGTPDIPPILRELDSTPEALP